jgi:hypothetical protein
VFNNDILDLWLDKKATEIVTAMGERKPLSPEDMMVLMLKAQINYFNHLDIDMRSDMITPKVKEIEQKFSRAEGLTQEDINTNMRWSIGLIGLIVTVLKLADMFL